MDISELQQAADRVIVQYSGVADWRPVFLEGLAAFVLIVAVAVGVFMLVRSKS
jgi:hypothetical protein